MKRIINISFHILLSLISLQLYSQNAISIDGSAADGSAMLEIKSSNKGLLMPRLTETQIGEISEPANGLMVFCTTDNKFYTYISGSGWQGITYGSETITPTGGASWTCGDPLLDSRDNQSYTTVLIGIQCWMAENLNIGTRIDGSQEMQNNSSIEKYCSNDSESNCDTYGGLYQWDEMMQYSTTEEIQGICPNGWHLPTDIEWIALINYLGGQNVAGGKMKSTSGWYNNGNGSNSSGFIGLPGGYRNGNGSFYSLGYNGYWFSSSEFSSSGNAWNPSLFYDYDIVFYNSSYKTNGFSVRCIKD